VTYGAANKPITFTARSDVVPFIAYVFTKLPASRLEWGTFRLEGERTVSQFGLLSTPLL